MFLEGCARPVVTASALPQPPVGGEVPAEVVARDLDRDLLRGRVTDGPVIADYQLSR